MPRPPVISEADIESAVQTLKGTGTPINPYQVRKLLGKGSVEKIAYFLKALGVTADYKGEAEDPWTSRMANLLRPVAIELEEKSKDRIQKATEHLNDELNEKDGLLSELEGQLAERQSLIDATEAKLSIAISERDDIRNSHQKLEIKVASLEEKVAQQADRLESANEQIQQRKIEAAEAHLEHQTAVDDHKAALRIMQDNHQAAIDSYKSTIDERNQLQGRLSNDLAEANAALLATKNEFDAFKQQWQKDIADAERLEASLKATISRQEEQITTETKQREQLNQQLLEARESYQTKIKERQQQQENDNQRLIDEVQFLRDVVGKFEILNQKPEAQAGEKDTKDSESG